VQEY